MPVNHNGYGGDILEDDTIDLVFNSLNKDLDPKSLSASGAVAVYKANNTTQTTTGVTLTEDFDGVTGLNQVHIDATDAFYVAGETYHVILTAGTVDLELATQSDLAGLTVGSFSIQDRRAKADVTHFNGTAGTFTVAGKPDVTLANGAHGGTSATVRLGGSTATPALYVTNSGGDAAQFESTGGNGYGFDLLGSSLGGGMRMTGGAQGAGLVVAGGVQGDGISITGANGILITASDSDGIFIDAPQFGIISIGDVAGTNISGGTTGIGLAIDGGSTSGDAVRIATTSGDGIDFTGVVGGAPLHRHGLMPAPGHLGDAPLGGDPLG